jgi:hypothetical protein
MNDTAPAYGLWFLVIINSAIFTLFAFSCSEPQSKREWRSVSGHAVHRDVRLPAGELCSVGLVAEPLSERPFVLA